jgi:hypothetical protein
MDNLTASLNAEKAPGRLLPECHHKDTFRHPTSYLADGMLAAIESRLAPGEETA